MRQFQFFLFVICFIPLCLQGQSDYFQQQVDVDLDVQLDDVAHEVSGTCIITYHNNAPQSLNEIYFHLWGNAYKDRSTAFAKQMLKNRSTKFHFGDESTFGNFKELQFKTDKVLSYQNYEDNPDIVVVKLDKALKSGEKLKMEIPFTLKIPISYSRLGHVETSYQMTQWYPKPAVFDKDGWHPMPYLNQGEFYSEFGDYHFKLTLPENYVVAATGSLTTDSEIAYLDQKVVETRTYLDTAKTISTPFPPSSEKLKTIEYIAENVHDYAWFADKRFFVEKGNVELSNGKQVDTWVYYTEVEAKLWKDALSYVDRAVEFYSEHVGNYPYPHATAVQSALSMGGGMEYPMITVIGTMGSPKALDGVITHEVGHNWFYGILAFNERDYPWLDEGINSYYDHRYSEKFWPSGGGGGLPKFISKDMEEGMNKNIYLIAARNGLDQPPVIHSTSFKDMTRYFMGAYEKPAVAIKYLQYSLGTDEFDKIMKSFYQKWAFKHPGPDDFRAHFESNTDENLDWFFDGLIGSSQHQDYSVLAVKKGEPYSIKVKNKGKIVSPIFVSGIKDSTIIAEQQYDGIEGSQWLSFPAGDYDKIIIDKEKISLDLYRHNNKIKGKGSFKKGKGVKLRFITGGDGADKHYINYIPALGGNTSDGFMLGMTFHNIHVPNRSFQYVLTPMYGFKSNDLVGTASLYFKHVINSEQAVRNIRYGVESRRFHYNYNEDQDYNLSYFRVSPFVGLDLDKNKSNLLNAQLNFKVDYWEERRADWNDTGNFVGTYTNPGINKEVEYVLKKTSILDPAEITVSLNHLNYKSLTDKDESFLKASLEAIQSYQYLKNKYLRLRLFAGGFITHSQGDQQTSFVNKGNFGLTGESHLDHHFQDFYFNRSGSPDQYSLQIHERDGGFKVPIGSAHGFAESNQFIISTNFEIDIPKLPSYLPVRIYADLAFMQNQSLGNSDIANQIFYDLGLRIKAGKVLAVNFPLYQSEKINNVLKERGNYSKRISFTLDLNEMKPSSILREFGIM